jgi:hypothetical protein
MEITGFQLGQICGGLVIGFLLMAAYWLLRGLFAGVGRFVMGPRRNPPAFYQAPYSEDVADNEAGPLIWRPEDDPFNDRTKYQTFESLLDEGREPSYTTDWKPTPRKDKDKRGKSKYEEIGGGLNNESWIGRK